MAAVFNNDWQELLAPEFEKQYYLELRSFLKTEYRTQTIYPDMHEIFSTLQKTAYRDVKVVIIGQDPYHGEGQAHGFSFSVKPGVDIPPSLKNIYKELQSELGCYVPNNGYLMKWAEQGVLMLNAVLTVRAGMANSHKGMGWEQFTDRVISLLNERDTPMVFLLWGRNASAKASLITNGNHLILEAAHPSPLSAYNGFFGCGHFKTANDFLVSKGMKPVDWQIENI